LAWRIAPFNATADAMVLETVLDSCRCRCNHFGKRANSAVFVAHLSAFGAARRFDRCGDRHLGYRRRMVWPCAALEAPFGLT